MWGSGYPASLMLVDKDDTMFYYRIYIIQLYLKVLCLEGDNANQRPHDRSPAKYSYSNCYCAHPDKGKESSQQETPQMPKWQGIMTVLLTASVYSISFVPFIIYHIVEMFTDLDP